MRWNLLKTFDEIYVVNLHGNAKKRETAPDGGKDENVFNIMQGVSINIFVKKGNYAPCLQGKTACKHGAKALATVKYCDLYGKRGAKFDWLDVSTFESIKWEAVMPSAPMYFFVPRESKGSEEYNTGFKVDELFGTQSMGVTTGCDSVLVATNAEELLASVFKKFGVDDDKKILRYSYRPFDEQMIYYDPSLMARSREKFMRNFPGNSNMGLCLIKICSRDDDCPAFVTNRITDKTILSSKDNANVFPLYLYEENFGKIEKRPNFNAEVYDKIAAAVERKPAPEEVFDYIYAVLHTPEYRSKYKEFLKVDFPCIPYPKSAAVFDRLVAFGGELRNAHLLKDKHSLLEKVAAFAVAGENVVEGVRYEDGRVYVNGTQYFDAVPEDIFNFHIGGYQPAQKWLKDRKGRVLTNDDCDHYQSIVLALIKTRDVMSALSKFSAVWMD